MNEHQNRHLGPSALVEVLAPSIATDPTIQAASSAVDNALAPIVQAIPRMLIWARLWQDESRLSPSLHRIVQHCGGLPPLSDAELELLAWQMHVDFWDPAWPRKIREDLIKYSTSWHRIKGTPRSIINALALFGYTATIEEDGTGDHWATYQLGLPQIADVATVKKILSIAREMQPVRCRLWRMYTDVWDMRPAIYSGKHGYSEAYYSFYSGVPVPDDPAGGAGSDDVLVSFGHKRSTQTPLKEIFPHMGIERLRSTLCFRLDTLLYGYACYSDKPIRNHGFARYRLRQVHFNHTKTVWHFSRRSISRIQAVYGESPYGDTNSRYGRPTVVTIDNPPVYGQSLYGLHDCERHAHTLDEVTLRPRCATTAPYPWSTPPHSAHDRQGVHAAQADAVFPPNATWHGRWDTRRWRAFGAQTLFTRSIDI